MNKNIFNHETRKIRRFILWPERCILSKRIIFMKYAYELHYIHHSYGWGINCWKTVFVNIDEILLRQLSGELDGIVYTPCRYK